MDEVQLPQGYRATTRREFLKYCNVVQKVLRYLILDQYVTEKGLAIR